MKFLTAIVLSFMLSVASANYDETMTFDDYSSSDPFYNNEFSGGEENELSFTEDETPDDYEYDETEPTEVQMIIDNNNKVLVTLGIIIAVFVVVALLAFFLYKRHQKRMAITQLQVNMFGDNNDAQREDEYKAPLVISADDD